MEVAQLSPGARELADLAGAVGRAFTVDLLGAASGFDPVSLTDGLDELWHRRIVRSVPAAGPNSFDFSHDLLRDVAYAELSPMKRRFWHLRVAAALEKVATDLDVVSAQLAAHYERAGEAERAISCYARAAEIAQRVYAHDEAIGLLRRGLTLLDPLADKVDNAHRGRQELDLLRPLSLALVATRGYGAPEVMDTLSRMQRLDTELDEPPGPPLLRALAIAHLNNGNFGRAHAFGEQLLELARDPGDSILLVEAHYVLGVTLSWTGSFTRSRHHLELALTHYDPDNSAAHVARYSQDPNVVCQCRLAFDLWCLGYPEQARTAQVKGLVQARELAHPFSLVYALTWDAMLHGCVGEFDSLVESAEAVLAIDRKHPLGLWSSWARLLKGWALAETGQLRSGIDELESGDEQMRAAGGAFLQPFALGVRANQLAKLGQTEHALALLDRGIADGGDGQSWYDAELQRLRGDLLLARSDDAREAEVAYRRAIQIARAQHAKVFELRATTSLARRWLRRGRSAEAGQALTKIYAWFTEGLDTTELQEARKLLNRCSR